MLNSAQRDKDGEEFMEGFFNWFREVPKPAITILDVSTCKRMQDSFEHILKAFENAGYKVHPDVEIDPRFYLGSISVEVEDTLELDISNFNIALSDADLFEIYPLTNGKLRLELTFHGVLKGVC